MKIAIYPGSFDPITNGHLDIIERASKLFDRIIVTVAVNPSKKYLFSTEERVKLIEETIKDLPNVEVDHFEGLLADYAKRIGAIAIIRGLRALSDFDYEFSLFLMNKHLAPEVDTVFLMTREENSFISSSLIREVVSFGGDIVKYVPEPVAKALYKKFGESR